MCIVLQIQQKGRKKKERNKRKHKKTKEKKRKACGTRTPKSKEINSSGDYCCLQMGDDHWFKTFALTHIIIPTVNFFTDSQEITILGSRKKNLTKKDHVDDDDDD
jgi:hypothetical protein